MKKVTCVAVQGPVECPHVFEIENFEDFMTRAHAHFGEQHPEMVADVSDEDKAKWNAMAKEVVESTSEEATPETPLGEGEAKESSTE
jgi:hypothetical protein